ncbi:protein of unknown function DUF81 [Gloeothece citriformis PCC 7424]|uniref:Probable membrane transporter protein n=1 Tax=Gloeothece citriformis (strain PCC 7424) TaxID=65393 RepID=B7KA08_GLOC7|nr:sulfite exporter TauE/SafE family protein [Gloeothece citriformis]ACK71364.1 protein of unknown function DUF81 [Gloeothece citriformis PCC 7424]
MMNEIFVSLVIFIAGFIQSVAGFGFGLITMPILTEVLDFKIASSLIALISIITHVAIIFSYQSFFQFKAVLRLIIASIIGIPIGFLAVDALNKTVILTLLGILVMSYVIWTLLDLKLPKLESPKWAYGFGLLSGLLSGAYNIGGPPVIIYGNCSQWSPEEFKSNLNGFFLFNTVLIIFGHVLNKNYTVEVGKLFLIALPFLLIGLGIGTYFSKFLNPSVFRKIILVLLLFISIRLIYLTLSSVITRYI